MFEKLSKCPYCSANIKVSAEDVFVVCEYCGREMEVPRFTQEEKRLTQAVEEMRASTEAAEAALREAMERAEESDAQMEERIAALAEQQAEDSVQARMHRDELLSQLRANAIEQREAAKAHLHELESEQHRLSDQLEGLRREQQAGKAASLQHCYALGESAQSAGRFDEAIEHFQKLLVMSEDHEAEVHWRIVMCRYGVEYVREQSSETWLPTITHMIVDSIEDDADYRAAAKYARSDRMRSYYRDEARRIDDILDKYREVYGQEKPYDVFISVKQGDDKGRPTEDSMVAMDLYYMLTGMGLHVFNSRISLQEHAGLEYEPYIMAALMTSKAMLVVGTRSDYMNSPWVRNEWRRFRWLQENGKEARRLIAYVVGMRTSEIPKEMGALQIINAQTSGDPKGQLRRVVEKDFGSRRQEPAAPQPVNHDEEAALLRRAEMFLEEGSVDKCEEYLERVLDRNPEAGKAHALKLCIAVGVETIEDLEGLTEPISRNINYRRAVSYGDAALKQQLEAISNSIQKKIDAEAERKAAEEAARAERERQAAEEKARIERERKAAEEKARAEAERKAAEEKARIERERKAAEERARAERERKAAEERARAERERKAAEERARIERERKAAEERARAERERKAAEEAARAEAERKAAEEAQREVFVEELLGSVQIEAVSDSMRKSGEKLYKKAEALMRRAETWAGLNLYDKEKKLQSEAVELYRQAADMGNTDAMCELASLYEWNSVTGKDEAKALELYRKAAAMGSTKGMCGLAQMYKYGRDDSSTLPRYMRQISPDDGRVRRDYAKALALYRKAADMGGADGVRGLAYMYRDGCGVEQNYSEALTLYRKAADMGDGEAMYCLGVLYEYGNGAEENIDEAIKWYQKAVKAGADSRARGSLVKLKRARKKGFSEEENDDFEV